MILSLGHIRHCQLFTGKVRGLKVMTRYFKKVLNWQPNLRNRAAIMLIVNATPLVYLDGHHGVSIIIYFVIITKLPQLSLIITGFLYTDVVTQILKTMAWTGFICKAKGFRIASPQKRLTRHLCPQPTIVIWYPIHRFIGSIAFDGVPEHLVPSHPYHYSAQYHDVAT